MRRIAIALGCSLALVGPAAARSAAEQAARKQLQPFPRVSLADPAAGAGVARRAAAPAVADRRDRRLGDPALLRLGRAVPGDGARGRAQAQRAGGPVPAAGAPGVRTSVRRRGRRKGAIGLAQLMPHTARLLRRQPARPAAEPRRRRALPQHAVPQVRRLAARARRLQRRAGRGGAAPRRAALQRDPAIRAGAFSGADTPAAQDTRSANCAESRRARRPRNPGEGPAFMARSG